MSNPAPPFKLSATLRGHNSDVRAVLLPSASFALTASRDGSTRIWKRTSTAPPPVYEPDESSHGNQFKTCLAYLPPSVTKEFPDGLVFSAGQDTLIEARQPGTTAEQNADAMMVGHSGQVCSLDVSPEGGWLVSGSWDNTAKLWSIGKWESEAELVGHTAAVWAVLAYGKTTVVTGCADRAIRVFELRNVGSGADAKMVMSFDARDIVRALVKLPDGFPGGAQIAAATNDGVIRLWTLQGQLIAELHGHEAFIYSLDVLPETGEIVSSGEDRSVRVWQGTECVQVLTLPAISIWSVSTSPEGDIIAGSSDKMARIFTRSEERLADAGEIAQFDEAVQSSALPKQQAGEVNTTDLPGPDFLKKKAGTKEGQTAIVKDESGQPMVYQWSMSQQTWQKIGQLVDSAGAGEKATYKGKEYDYVFDVDIEDGKPPLKLPYNITQNPYDAATKFLNDNELPVSYLEETANFIVKNTQGATIGQQQGDGARDTWGTENRYRPGDGTSDQPTSFSGPYLTSKPRSALPQREYLPIVLGKPSAAIGQISKLNAEYQSSSSPLALTDVEIQTLTQLATSHLDKYNFQSSKATLSPISVTPAMPALLKIINTWQPIKNRLAGLDLLRFVAVATSELSASSDENGSIETLFTSPIFQGQNLDNKQTQKLAMIGYRIFANMLYASKPSRLLVQIHAQDVLNHINIASNFVNETTDPNFAVALTTLALNLSVLLTSERTEASEPQGTELMDSLVRILGHLPRVNHDVNAPAIAQTTEVAYRAVVALGTIIAGIGTSDIKKVARSQHEVGKLVQGLKDRKYGAEPRFEKVFSEILAVLR